MVLFGADVKPGDAVLLPERICGGLPWQPKVAEFNKIQQKARYDTRPCEWLS